MIGRTLAHYKILEKIGSGGMGDVYLAEDQKLGRKIALKILPAETATRDRLRRFEQEAKAVAALNHPNIVQVYSVEESDGLHFITMEWVAGKTLAASIPSKGLPLSRFLEIAIPMVDAVSAAHEKGIIHRDLKPDNAMLSEEGRVKILDFGLAKLRPEAAGSLASESPTLSATRDGHIVGTVAYMSPEQAEGKTVDHRTDIFSLGIVLFEMLSGERPFAGETPAAIMSATIKDVAPSVAELRPDVPRDVSRIVRRCLTKDLGRRFQSAADLRNDFEDLKEALGSGELHEAQPERRPRAAPWLAAGAAACLLAVVGYLVLRGGTPESTAIRLTNPVQLTSAVGVEDYPTWSANGQRLAYHSDQSGNWDIWVSQLGVGDAVNFTADHADEDRLPFLVSRRPTDRFCFPTRWDLGCVYDLGARGKPTQVGDTRGEFPKGATHLVGRWGRARYQCRRSRREFRGHRDAAHARETAHYPSTARGQARARPELGARRRNPRLRLRLNGVGGDHPTLDRSVFGGRGHSGNRRHNERLASDLVCGRDEAVLCLQTWRDHGSLAAIPRSRGKATGRRSTLDDRQVSARLFSQGASSLTVEVGRLRTCGAFLFCGTGDPRGPTPSRSPRITLLPRV